MRVEDDACREGRFERGSPRRGAGVKVEPNTMRSTGLARPRREGMKRGLGRLLSAILVFIGGAPAAPAEEEVKIGAIYPLTGAAASTGLELKNAVELAAELINQGGKGLNLPLAGKA